MCFSINRCVPDELRALGLGLQWVCLRLLGKKIKKIKPYYCLVTLIPPLARTLLRRKGLVRIYGFSLNQQYWIYHCQIVYMSCLIVTLHVPVYCVINNAFIRLYQPNFKITRFACAAVTRKLIFSYTVFDIERELFLLQ